MTERTSLTPAVTAESSTKRRSAAVATRWASVVLPVPGRPPEDRRQRSRGPAGALDEPAQRAAGAQHLGLAPDLVEGAGPHPDGERGDAGRRRAARRARRRRPHRRGPPCCSTSLWKAIRVQNPSAARARRRAPGWLASAHSSPATRARWVVAWAVIAIACFAVAVGGVTGESLFERLHSGAPTVESESSRAQERHRREPAGARDADDAGDRCRPHRRGDGRRPATTATP